MELRLTLLCLILGLFACQSNTISENTRIGQLTATLAANPTKANRAALIAAYRDTINAKPNAVKVNTAHFSKIAELYLANKEPRAAVQMLMQGIKAYPNVDGVAEKVWQIADIYQQQLQRSKVAITVKKLYAQTFGKGAQFAAAQKVATEQPVSIAQDITDLGSSMYDETTHKVDNQAADDYITICELFALLKPADPQSPEYLHKAGETARAVRVFPKAIEIYDKIYTNYPDYDKAAQALFLKAFTYDNDIGDKTTAKALYEEFLQKYPNDDFADDTQFLLDNLGKNDEEIIKGFSER
ncbi:MAG: tetratricopeptide repeat protein [Bacteroidota bacterium]